MAVEIINRHLLPASVNRSAFLWHQHLLFTKSYLLNVYGLEDTIQNRTNNPLERYNLRLGKQFPVDHPLMCGFIGGINTIANEYVDLLERIKHGRATAPVHLPCRMEEIPQAYEKF